MPQPAPEPARTPDVLTCRHCVEPVIKPNVAAVLMVGLLIVGAVPNMTAPEPVSPVTADARLALEGVPRKVAMPAPRPLTPVLIGSPVRFVAVPELGVP